MRSRFNSIALILMATAIAGVIGYFITWLVPREIGFSAYAAYAIFWSVLYLVLSALSGIQQEVARATVPRNPGTPRSGASAGLFALAAACVVAILVVASAPLWVGIAFPVNGWPLVFPLAVGTASYVVIAVMCGSLYGVAGWRYLFVAIGGDAVLRLVGLSIALAFTHNVVALAWAVVVPFPGMVLLLWPRVRRVLVGRTLLDVNARRLVWNVSRTIAAAASLGVMVSGFPFLLGLTSSSASKVELGLLILAITLTRAPLIVVVVALQGFLVVYFRDAAAGVKKALVRAAAPILTSGIVLALAAWLVGPAVFAFLFPAEPTPKGWLLATLVASSCAVGLQSVAGCATLAVGRHGGYSAGWVVAAALTVVLLALPLGLVSRCVVALIVGPSAGLIVHLVVLFRTIHRGALVMPAGQASRE